MADGEFAELQQRLRALWPSVTLRSIGDVERTVVVVHSISMDVPDQLIPVFPAYEERFLCLVLSLLRSRGSRVIYVTSQPILPRLVDYYFGLVPELDTAEARSRFSVVSLVDGRNLPLTKKLLDAARARSSGSGRSSRSPSSPFLLPFATSPRRGRARGPARHPALRRRPRARVARDEDAAAGASSPTRASRTRAASNVAGEDDVLRAIRELRARRRSSSSTDGVSGLGNALVDMPKRARRRRARATRSRWRTPRPASSDYLAALEEQGGIVEERIEGDDLRSPSAQLRISPSGQVDILSTHDQVLGGPHGQTYFGCRFPADPEYAPQIAVEALKIGRRLAREGVIGRCAVDFVAVRRDGDWEPYAIEINLRCGGTTHPFMAISTLTDGVVRPARGRVPDAARRPEALRRDRPPRRARVPGADAGRPARRRRRAQLGWDAERETGVALHMVSALAVAGPDRADGDRRHAVGGERALPRAEAGARRARGEGGGRRQQQTGREQHAASQPLRLARR